MNKPNNQPIKTFAHSLSISAFDRFKGQKIHLFLTNKFHYLCRIEKIVEIDNHSFLEIFDFEKSIYLMINLGDVSLIKEVAS